MMRHNSTQRGYDVRWRKLSKAYLARHPHCAMCARAGRLVPATVVDHIVPHKLDSVLFWDQLNWQSLCAPCHNGPKQSAERRGYSRTVDASGWPADPRHPANRRQQ
jgi:5-methylcytosine-specific restriction protein A